MKKLAAAMGATAALTLGAAPVAGADPPPVTGVGAQGGGAFVLHCSQFGTAGPSEGVFVLTPRGDIRGSNRNFNDCILGGNLP